MTVSYSTITKTIKIWNVYAHVTDATKNSQSAPDLTFTASFTSFSSAVNFSNFKGVRKKQSKTSNFKKKSLIYFLSNLIDFERNNIYSNN